MWNFLAKAFETKHGVPRIENVVIASFILAFTAFFFLFSLPTLPIFEGMLDVDFRKQVHALVDSEFLLPPVIVLVFFFAICTFICIWIISRARSVGYFLVSADGVLHHANQINIAMRVATFQAMLAPLAKRIDVSELDNSFYEGGFNAGTRFGKAFPETYRLRIQKGGMPNWDELPIEQKIAQWRRYDQQSGWGELNEIMHDNQIVVQIIHPSLFREAIGIAWTHFMGGYIEGLLNEIHKPRGQLSFNRKTGIVNQGDVLTLTFPLQNRK